MVLTSRCESFGIRPAAARNNAVLNEPARKLPESPIIVMARLFWRGVLPTESLLLRSPPERAESTERNQDKPSWKLDIVPSGFNKCRKTLHGIVLAKFQTG